MRVMLCDDHHMHMAAGAQGGPALADSLGWQDLMKVVQRSAVVVTEDMPVDPEAHDLQVLCLASCKNVNLCHLEEPQVAWLVNNGLVRAVTCGNSRCSWKVTWSA